MAIPAGPHTVGQIATEDNDRPVICLTAGNPGTWDTDWANIGGELLQHSSLTAKDGVRTLTGTNVTVTDVETPLGVSPRVKASHVVCALDVIDAAGNMSFTAESRVSFYVSGHTTGLMHLVNFSAVDWRFRIFDITTGVLSNSSIAGDNGTATIAIENWADLGGGAYCFDLVMSNKEDYVLRIGAYTADGITTDWEADMAWFEPTDSATSLIKGATTRLSLTSSQGMLENNTWQDITELVGTVTKDGFATFEASAVFSPHNSTGNVDVKFRILVDGVEHDVKRWYESDVANSLQWKTAHLKTADVEVLTGQVYKLQAFGSASAEAGLTISGGSPGGFESWIDYTQVLVSSGEFVNKDDVVPVEDLRQIIATAGSATSVTSETLTLLDGKTWADINAEYEYIEFSYRGGASYHWGDGANAPVAIFSLAEIEYGNTLDVYHDGNEQLSVTSGSYVATGTTATFSTAGTGFRDMTIRGIKAQKRVVDPTVTTVNDQAASEYVDIGAMRIQWGQQTISAVTNITYPVPFANATYSLTTGGEALHQRGNVKTTTGFTAALFDSANNVATGIFEWQAIGLKP